MAFVKEKGECLCERCGHWWKSKPFPGGRYVEPTSCAKCKSKVWNKPRVYGGKYNLDNLLARREKPTGRAAAALRPERIKAEKLEKLERIIERDTRIINSYLDDLKSKLPINHYSISGFAYDFFSKIDERLAAKFEIADLTETDPKENFYLKRGQISSEIERWRDLPDLIYKKDEIEFRAGFCDERTAKGDERARHWYEFLNEAMRRNEQLQTLYYEMQVPTPTSAHFAIVDTS